MTGVTPMAGAVSPRESGPGSILAHFDFSTSPLRAVISPALDWAGASAAGIAFGLEEGGEGERFAIRVVDAYGAPLVGLGSFSDEDAVAEWRRLGAASGLPLVIERTDGGFDQAYPQIGPLLLGAIRIRRRHGLLNGRRPRFLTRRKTSRLPLRPAVHREREITSRGS